MAKLSKEQQQLNNFRWVNNLLVSAQNREWFGDITIQIKKGEIVMVTRSETMKPPTVCCSIEKPVGVH